MRVLYVCTSIRCSPFSALRARHDGVAVPSVSCLTIRTQQRQKHGWIINCANVFSYRR
jgi:hypothetical protein